MDFIIQLFACLLFFSSFIHIGKLVLDYNWYMDTYSYLPVWLAVGRYLFSWFQRIIGLTVAFGLLYRKNFARLLGMVLGVFTISTIFWKHPYDGMLRHIHFLFETNPTVHKAIMESGVTLSGLTIAVIIVHSLLDIIFWVLYINFFRKEKIKVKFH